MRNLPAAALFLLASCMPPEHPDYAGPQTTYERGDTPEVVRSVIEKQFGIQSDGAGEIVSAWKPLYDKDEDLHYRVRAIVRIHGDGPYRIELRMPREDKDFVSGRWHPRGEDEAGKEELRRDLHRALGRR